MCLKIVLIKFVELDKNKTFGIKENNAGGREQSNPAHIVDLISALAVLDFEANYQGDKMSGKTEHKEFGIKAKAEGTSDSINFRDLHNQTNDIIRTPLIQMYLTVKYLDNHFRTEGLTQPWATRRQIDGVFVKSKYYEEVKDFAARFNNWIKEMKRTKRSFSLYEDKKADADVFDTIDGVTPNGYGFFSPKSYSFIDKYLNQESNDGATKDCQFLKLFNNATVNVIKDKFNF